MVSRKLFEHCDGTLEVAYKGEGRSSRISGETPVSEGVVESV